MNKAERVKRWQAAGHTPEARAKAAATLRKVVAARKAAQAAEGNGATKTGGARAWKTGSGRRSFTPEQKAELVAKINAEILAGSEIGVACMHHKVHESQYRQWNGGQSARPRFAKKGNGSVTTFDVSSLPKKRGKYKPQKRQHTTEERLAIVERVRAAIASGVPATKASRQEGVADNTYRAWLKNYGRDKKRAGGLPVPLNGHAKMNGHQGAIQVNLLVAGISLQVAGQPVSLSLQDAIRLQQGLDTLLRAPNT